MGQWERRPRRDGASLRELQSPRGRGSYKLKSGRCSQERCGSAALGAIESPRGRGPYIPALLAQTGQATPCSLRMALSGTSCGSLCSSGNHPML